MQTGHCYQGIAALPSSRGGGGGVFSLPKATVVVAGNRENIAGFLSQRSGGGGTVQNGAGIRANAFHG